MELAISDADACLIQECVALATGYPVLSSWWTDAITLVLLMMDARQRDFFRFETLYPEVVDKILQRGSEADPIVIDDDEAD